MTQEAECPNCGNTQFSWVVEQVQFGTVQVRNGNIQEPLALESGAIIGDNIDENGYYCTECNEFSGVSQLQVPTENPDAPLTDDS